MQNYLILILIFLSIQATPQAMGDKKINLFGLGFTGDYQNPMQGFSYSYYHNYIYVGVNINRDSPIHGGKHKEVLVGFNFIPEYRFKNIKKDLIFFTTYVGYHQTDGPYDGATIGLRFNYKFKNLPIGLFVDTSIHERTAFGAILDLGGGYGRRKK